MAVAATGFFDGVHIGHRLVINTLLDISAQKGEPGRVITFWPHPRAVFQSDARGFGLLSSAAEREALLRECGVPAVDCIPFDKEFGAKTAQEYLQMLSGQGVSTIVLGYDNRFGSDGLSTAQIAAVAREMGLDAIVCESVKVDAVEVSSTRIRAALECGLVEDAAVMLGRPYDIAGVVVAGHQMGRTIGFPTANIKLREPLKCLPGVGAYFGYATVLGEVFPAMINISCEGLTEAHLLDFSRDIYGLDIKLTFESKIREEMHFYSLEELKNQLEKDRMACFGK